MRFLLFVGAENTLAGAEIEVQIKTFQTFSPHTFLLEFPSETEAIMAVEKLGSAIKLAKELPNVSASAIPLADLIKKDFSVTNLSDFTVSPKINQQIKNILGKGRFVLPKNPHGLSPVILKKHKISEFFLDSQRDEVWETIWVHDFRHWIKKDRHMPFANARAGILPPKIARSMVNLVPGSPEGKLLLDPFCGSGRILVEAAEVGFRIAGADIAASQIKETEANLASLGFKAHLETLDATHLSDKFNDVDAIVTEPFLGKPNLRPDQIKYLVPGLQKLYLGCLKDWQKVLKPGGFIVMVFPWFDDGRHIYKTSTVIDGKHDLGYNSVKRGLLYSRPGAEVKREIVILQKK